MIIWFCRKRNGTKIYFSKSISLYFYPQHWKTIQCKSNGAKKDDKCYDLNIHFLGLHFSYTNFDYNI